MFYIDECPNYVFNPVFRQMRMNFSIHKIMCTSIIDVTEIGGLLLFPRQRASGNRSHTMFAD